jgi:hypothetical protein
LLETEIKFEPSAAQLFSPVCGDDHETQGDSEASSTASSHRALPPADGHPGSDSESSDSFDSRFPGDGDVGALAHGAQSVQDGAEALGQALPPQADVEIKTEDRDSMSPFQPLGQLPSVRQSDSPGSPDSPDSAELNSLADAASAGKCW